MEQLLKITTIPIEYELQINKAEIAKGSGSAIMEVVPDIEGNRLRGRPIKIQIDSFDARNSITPTTMTSVYQNAEKGKTAAYNAIAQFAQEGKMLLTTQIGQGAEALDRIFKNRIQLDNVPDVALGFSPSKPIEISAEGNPYEMRIQYDWDKANFDWKIGAGKIEFIPGTIEIEINQHPEVQIEYIGDPIYVPPSSMPGHGEVVDVKA